MGFVHISGDANYEAPPVRPGATRGRARLRYHEHATARAKRESSEDWVAAWATFCALVWPIAKVTGGNCGRGRANGLPEPYKDREYVVVSTGTVWAIDEDAAWRVCDAWANAQMERRTIGFDISAVEAIDSQLIIEHENDCAERLL